MSLDSNIATAFKLLHPEVLDRFKGWIVPGPEESHGKAATDVLHRVVVPVVARINELQPDVVDDETFSREMTATIRSVMQRGDAGRLECLVNLVEKLRMVVMDEVLADITVELNS